MRNPGENMGTPTPEEAIVGYQLEGSHDGVFWDVCASNRWRSSLTATAERCPHKHHRVVRVTREILEELP